MIERIRAVLDQIAALSASRSFSDTAEHHLHLLLQIHRLARQLSDDLPRDLKKRYAEALVPDEPLIVGSADA